jgi:cyclopropane-fatty-acyl-phospholipid synthase
VYSLGITHRENILNEGGPHMSMQRQLVERLASKAGVVINGNDPWDIKVKDDRFYERALEKNLGLGEAYMDSWWECDQLDELICRILKNRVDRRIKDGIVFLLHSLLGRVFNLQSKKRSKIIAERHYDLDNDLFLSFLDPYNQYSCAYFGDTDDLSKAQQNKLDLICKKIGLNRNDHVLDIGCGWGGFARYAAEHYGCTVTAVNISREQLRFARESCKELPVNFIDCDYRDIKGTFDKIISIGMFEHVGHKNYRRYMQAVHRCLKNGGIFLLHTIGSNESTKTGDPWINKYIFPHGKLPSVAQIGKAIEGLFVMEDLHNLGPHYDKTLKAWHENFRRAWPRLKVKYDDRFRRMWEYYLLSCAGLFRARRIQVWQIVLTKYGTEQPVCRF